MKREDIKRSYEVVCRLEQIDKDIININKGDINVGYILLSKQTSNSVSQEVAVQVSETTAMELAWNTLFEEKQKLEKELEELLTK